MAQDNYGLLLAALVAVVAVVGLVILFSGSGASGAPTWVCDGQVVQTSAGYMCIEYSQLQGRQYDAGSHVVDTRYQQAQRELMIAQDRMYYEKTPTGNQYY